MEMISLAHQMIDASAHSLLIKGTAAEVAEAITEHSEVPVISCGLGAGCDGQILVAPDILGLTQGPSPKFAKICDNLAQRTIDAFTAYGQETRSGKFPDAGHSYNMKAREHQNLLDWLQEM
jgi:3-methyl-2-oxobutanoate hydroxymethyltransferase